MKTPTHLLNRIYPHGFMWHIWRHRRTGQLCAQHRPHGGETMPLGPHWVVVRSMPHDPNIDHRLMEHRLFAGLCYNDNCSVGYRLPQITQPSNP